MRTTCWLLVPGMDAPTRAGQDRERRRDRQQTHDGNEYKAQADSPGHVVGTVSWGDVNTRQVAKGELS